MSAEVTAPAPSSVVVSIPASGSLSERLVVKGKVCGLIMPAEWDPADITFQGGQDGSATFNIYDDGVERMIPSAQAQAGRMISLDLNDWLCINAIKIRSGTSAAPVPQTARRDIVLILAG